MKSERFRILLFLPTFYPYSYNLVLSGELSLYIVYFLYLNVILKINLQICLGSLTKVILHKKLVTLLDNCLLLPLPLHTSHLHAGYPQTSIMSHWFLYPTDSCYTYKGIKYSKTSLLSCACGNTCYNNYWHIWKTWISLC